LDIEPFGAITNLKPTQTQPGDTGFDPRAPPYLSFCDEDAFVDETGHLALEPEVVSGRILVLIPRIRQETGQPERGSYEVVLTQLEPPVDIREGRIHRSGRPLDLGPGRPTRCVECPTRHA